MRLIDHVDFKFFLIRIKITGVNQIQNGLFKIIKKKFIYFSSRDDLWCCLNRRSAGLTNDKKNCRNIKCFQPLFKRKERMKLSRN
jgi:hypothetical protein